MKPKPIQPNDADAVREAKVRDNKVAERATRRAQLTFSLVEQDKSAPITIGFWIMANIETAPAQKLYDALETALLMRVYKSRKFAD